MRISPRILLVAAAAAWGTTLTLTKHVLSAFPPLFLLALMLAASVAALWTFVHLRGERLPGARTSATTAAAGLLEPGLAYAAGVWGLSLSSAGEAAILSALEPVIIMLLAWVALGKRVSLDFAVAGAVAFVGGLLVMVPSLEGSSRAHALGNGLLFGSVALAALYVTISSKLVVGQSPLVVTALQQSVGLLLAIVLAGLAMWFGVERVPEHIDVSAVFSAVVAGVVQYALAFWFYLAGLKETDVSEAGLYLLLTPVFGLAAAMACLGEELRLLQAIGVCVVLLAMAYIARGAKAESVRG